MQAGDQAGDQQGQEKLRKDAQKALLGTRQEAVNAHPSPPGSRC